MIALACALLLASQTFDADDLQRAGLVRIGDVLRLAEGWDLSSIEGFVLRATPPGAPLSERATYAVFVDGVFVPLDQLGATHPNRLPISLEDVERVTIDSAPTIVRGRFTHGAIRIETRRPDHSLELRARHVAGSETGDPGPFQFTELATPNVERFGFDSHATLGGRTGGGAGAAWGSASGRIARHYASDPLVLRRYDAIGGSEFHILEGEGGWFRGSWQGDAARAELFARGMGLDESYFLRPHGRELPVENGFAQAGATGTWQVREHVDLETHLVAASNELDGSARSAVPALDWKTRSVDWDLETNVVRGSLNGALGARASFRSARARTAIEDDEWTAAGAWGRITHADSAGALSSLDLAYEHDRGADALALLAGHRRPWSRGSIELLVSAASATPETSSPFWYWRENGLGVLEEEGVPVDADGSIQGARSLGLNAGATWALHPRWTLEASGFLRSFEDVALEDETFLYDPSEETFTSPVVLRTRENGTIAGSILAVSGMISSTSQLRAFWRYQDAVGGSSHFAEMARNAPRHVARIAWTTTPFRNFDVELALRGHSASEWPAYRDVSEPSAGRYDDRIPAWLAADFAARKWLWERRIRFGIAFRNVFDQEVRTHPIGKNEALTVIAELALRLPD